MKKPQKWAILAISLFAILVILTLLTHFYGSTDVYDYSNVAKLFAEKFSAKIRTSHSYLYGLIHAPFLIIFDSFLAFKITSLICLALLIYSVYRISGKDRRALWMMLLSPIVWFMGPWISPIQLASILFFWGYYFLKKYEEKQKIKHLFFAGALVGLSWAFWDAVLFFIPLLIISFFYDRKLLHSIYIAIFILLGAMPRFIVDTIIFGNPLFTVVRHVMASLTIFIYGGFYARTSLNGLVDFILVLVFIPMLFFVLFKPSNFKKDKKSMIFVLLSIILLVLNSQIRFVLLIAPIIILLLSKTLTKKMYIVQISLSIIILILVINPYIAQVKYDLGTLPYQEHDFGTVIKKGGVSISGSFYSEDALEDLKQIVSDHPGETFIAGNRDDSYASLANIYWGEQVKEFVSIQDYRLSLSGNSTIFEKSFCSNVAPDSRRDLCASVWIRKSFSDNTDYGAINYAISEEDSINLEDFKLIKRYKVLSLFEKV